MLILLKFFLPISLDRIVRHIVFSMKDIGLNIGDDIIEKDDHKPRIWTIQTPNINCKIDINNTKIIIIIFY